MIFVLLWSLLVSLATVVSIRQQTHVAVIDVSQLIEELSRPLAVQYPDGNVPQHILTGLMENIRHDMEVFANKRNVHLFAKASCFFKAGDLTEDFIKELRHEGHYHEGN